MKCFDSSKNDNSRFRTLKRKLKCTRLWWRCTKRRISIFRPYSSDKMIFKHRCRWPLSYNYYKCINNKNNNNATTTSTTTTTNTTTTYNNNNPKIIKFCNTFNMNIIKLMRYNSSVRSKIYYMFWITLILVINLLFVVSTLIYIFVCFFCVYLRIELLSVDIHGLMNANWTKTNSIKRVFIYLTLLSFYRGIRPKFLDKTGFLRISDIRLSMFLP